MKKRFLKSIAFLCSVVLLATSLFTGAFSVIAETPDAPDMADTLLGSVVGVVLDETREATYSSSGVTIFNISGLEAVDISQITSGGMIEFDFWVEDAAALKSAMAAANATFQVAVYGNDTYRAANAIPVSIIKNDGWNHVAIPKTNFAEGGDSSLSAVTKIVVNFYSTQLSAANGMQFAIANFCGTVLEKETVSTVGTKIAEQFTARRTANLWNNGSHSGASGYFPIKVVGQGPLNLSSYMSSNNLYMEFDIYISDYESFKTAVDNGVEINYYISSHSSAIHANYYKYDFSSQIYKEGWNHIVLEVSGRSSYDKTTPTQTDSLSNTSVKSYGFRVEGLKDTSALWNNMFAVTDLIFTTYSAPANATEYSILSSLTTTNGIIRNFTNRSGGNPSYDSTGSLYGRENLGDYDFSTAEFVEFDVFIEQYAIMNKEVNQQNLDLVLHLNPNSSLANGANTYIEYGFWDQITHSGWNHIVAPISEWTVSATAPNMASISSYRLKFTGAANASGLWFDSSTPDSRMGIYNIQATANKMFGTAVGKVLGGSGTVTYSSSGRTIFNISGLEAVNISQITSGGMIEFDFWVEDAAALKSAMASANATFQVAVYGNDTYRAANAIPVSIIKNDGWNHVVIPKTNFAEGGDSSLSAVTKIVVNFYDGTPTAANGMHFAIANFCGTTVNKETVSTVGTKIAEQFPAKRTANLWNNGSQSGASGYFPIKVVGQGPLNLSSYTGSNNLYMEFDIYISDYESFRTAVNNGVEINYYISSHSSAIHANYYKYDFSSQIYKEGWNHIVLEVSSRSSYDKTTPTQTDGFTNTSVKSYGFRVEGLNNTSALWNNMFAVTDLIFTTYSAPANATEYSILSSLTTTNGIIRNFTNRSGGNPSYDSTGSLYGRENLGDYDFSTAEFVEFDVFIEQYAVMNKEVNQQNLDLVLHLNPNSSLANGANTYIEYGFWDQITQPGWNHIVAPISEWTVSATTPDLTSISSYRLKFTGAANASGLWFDSSTPDSRMGIYNIRATTTETLYTFPRETVSAAYGDRYTLTLNQSSSTPLDFSEALFIEFDMYIENYQEFVESFKTDANGQSVGVSLNFGISMGTSFSTSAGYYLWEDIQKEVTKQGWNHISLLTGTHNQSKSTVNDVNTIENIRSWRIWYGGESYKNNSNYTNRIGQQTLTVKNVCATKTPVPSVTVGKDQTEVYVTWFVKGLDDAGSLVLKEGNTETVYEPYEHAASDAEPYYYSRVKVTGLKPNTNYTYRVGSEGNWSQEYSLNTKSFSNNFSFVQVSDIQLPSATAYYTKWKNTLSQINAYLPNTSFILNTGDVSDSATSNYNYIQYKSPELLKSYITGVIPGNHDSAPYGPYNEHFVAPESTRETYESLGDNQCDYWYGYNNILFIALNTNIKNTDYHEAFVRRIVAEQGSNYTWKIITCHNSIFSASYHNSEGDNVQFRSALAPVYSELGIDMVLSGHDHCYSRSYIMNGTTPVVSSNDYTYNTHGGVLYISCTSGSALKFNAASGSYADYTAKIVGPTKDDQLYGFMNYEVTDYYIKVTHYSSADMTVLDSYTVYKVNTGHMSTFRARVLSGETSNQVDYNNDSAKDIRDYVRLKRMYVNAA